MILYTSVVLLVVLASYRVLSEEMTDEKAMEFLKKYGYMKQNELIDDIGKGLKNYQIFNGLEVTGLLDSETKELMEKPRCGMMDIHDDNEALVAEYTVFGTPWQKEELTYFIRKYHRNLENSAVDNEMKDALDIWTKYTNLKFRRVYNEDADILISFESENHNDGFPFGKRILAHAFTPGTGIGGDAHFNTFLNWRTNDDSSNGYRLHSVAAHEFGHSLGLYHSDVRQALMYPYYHETNFRNNLHSDDIMGIQSIYGAKGTSSLSICESNKIDTIKKSPQGDIIAFVGQNYWQLPDSSNSTGSISSKWPNLPNNIDAAFTNFDKKTFYFKDSQVWKYDGTRMYSDYPKAISEEFPGIPDNIDTVFIWEQTKKLFFFKGNQLWGYRLNTVPHIESRYPVNIESWGIPTPFDASVIYHGKIFIFKDMQYYKLNLAKLRVAEGYPRSTRQIWFQCE